MRVCICDAGGILDGVLQATLRVGTLVYEMDGYLPLVVDFIFACCSSVDLVMTLCFVLQSVQQHVAVAIVYLCSCVGLSSTSMVWLYALTNQQPY